VDREAARLDAVAVVVAHALESDTMTAVETPVESHADTLLPAVETGTAGATAPVGRKPTRPSTYVAIGAVALVVLLAVFQYWVTSVEESRSQSELLRELKVDLANTANGGVPAPAATGHPIGLLEIPALGLEKVAVEGDSASLLERGPGHDPASARPGAAGDVLLVGRRSSYGAPFAHLEQLVDGDAITITTASGAFTYRVEHTATRASASAGNGTLTLATSAAGMFSDRVVSVTAVLEGHPLVLGTTLRALRPVDLTNVGGWFSDGSAWLAIALWGSLLVVALFIAARAYRKLSPQITYLLTTPVIVALLFCTLGALDRLVPVAR
jgi:sortase (surface protein transpeptidase)